MKKEEFFDKLQEFQLKHSDSAWWFLCGSHIRMRSRGKGLYIMDNWPCPWPLSNKAGSYSPLTAIACEEYFFCFDLCYN